MANGPSDEPKLANAAERLVYNKRRKFEAKHSALMEDLRAAGHQPQVRATRY